MSKVIKKAIKNLDAIFKEELKKEFEQRVRETKDLVIDEYMQLPDAVLDKESRTNPGLPKYIDAFTEELEEFEMITIKDASIMVAAPSIETFNFFEVSRSLF